MPRLTAQSLQGPRIVPKLNRATRLLLKCNHCANTVLHILLKIKRQDMCYSRPYEKSIWVDFLLQTFLSSLSFFDLALMINDNDPPARLVGEAYTIKYVRVRFAFCVCMQNSTQYATVIISPE